MPDGWKGVSLQPIGCDTCGLTTFINIADNSTAREDIKVQSSSLLLKMGNMGGKQTSVLA
jgi:hypothetical protein